MFDESYASLQGMGSAVNLSPWYDSAVVIKYMQFVSGSEEILFIDDLARARVFSLVTQQFRCANPSSTCLYGVVWLAAKYHCI